MTDAEAEARWLRRVNEAQAQHHAKVLRAAVDDQPRRIRDGYLKLAAERAVIVVLAALLGGWWWIVAAIAAAGVVSALTAWPRWRQHVIEAQLVPPAGVPEDH